MDKEPVPHTPEQEKKVGWTGWRKIAAVGAIAVAGIGAAAWNLLDKSGEYESYIPNQPVKPVVDQHLDIGSWNMHNETAERVNQIGKVISHGHLDIMALQEVSRDDLDDLEQRFPNWYMVYVMADAKTQPLDGGYGNVIMSRQKPEDIKSATLDGTSLLDSVAGTVEGFVIDVAHADTSLKKTKDGRQEDRAAIAITIKMQDKENPEELDDVRVIVSHISGMPEMHESQSEELMKFIKDNTEDGRPTVFCGDLNGKPGTIIPQFAEIGFITPETGPTSTDNSRTIDYCAYYEAGKLGLGDVSVLANPKTDHHPIVGSW